MKNNDTIDILDKFDIESNNIKYRCNIFFLGRHMALKSNLDMGYYMSVTPVTYDDNGATFHKEYKAIRMIKKSTAEFTSILDGILAKKESIATNILNNEHSRIQSSLIEKKIKNKMDNKKQKGFKAIGGYEEVKKELLEIVDFVENPKKYEKMDATLPKGILMYGPPGTGKTHFAKCLADECNFNFINMAGSEFVEKYQGVGAQKVRELFAKAKKEAPSIVFIDEIDAIGSKRSDDTGSSERNQTLNQLLIELDGFEESSSVIVICATNRMNILDDALKRAGRLDKHIYIGNPDMSTRLELFSLHTENKPLSDNVDLNELSKITFGFSCADIKNICNQASMNAIREDRDIVCHKDFEHAIEVSIGGITNKSKKLNEQEKSRVAYHEAGHALMNYLFSSSKIQKVSIIPRAQSLGCVMKSSTEDKFLQTKDELLDEIKILLAGKVAEEVQFGNSSTGASNDLEKASKIAFNLVSQYGLYDDNTLFSYNLNHIPDSLFIEYKNKAEKVLINCYNSTKELLTEKLYILEDIANALLEKEELTFNDIKDIIENAQQSK